MKKKMICALIATVLCLSSGMTAMAAPETMPDGGIFDAEYYAENNPDVVAVFGTDKNALYSHYVNFGRAEGRQPYESKASDTVVKETGENHLGALTTDLPVFSEEIRNKNNLLVPVNIEPLDGHYLKYTNLANRTYFYTNGWRKDYSNDLIYLAYRDYIVEWLIANQNNEDNRHIEIPITFMPRSREELAYFCNLTDNLEIDLHKSEICKDLTLFMGVTNADGLARFGDYFNYDHIIFCSIDYWETPNELFDYNKQQEIPINPETGFPAKPGDSWMLEDGTKYSFDFF